MNGTERMLSLSQACRTRRYVSLTQDAERNAILNESNRAREAALHQAQLSRAISVLAVLHNIDHTVWT